MMEVFKKEPVTSRDFPIILMAGHGILFHRQGDMVVVPQIVMEVCTELRQRDYRLGVVSNWKISLHQLLRDHLILDFFESVISSSEVGVEKPDPRIFQMALDDLDAAAHQALFVGASFNRDIEGARLAGLKSILYDPNLSEMKSLGLEMSALPPAGIERLPQGTERLPHADSRVLRLDDLRFQKKTEGLMVIRAFEELMEICL